MQQGAKVIDYAAHPRRLSRRRWVQIVLLSLTVLASSLIYRNRQALLLRKDYAIPQWQCYHYQMPTDLPPVALGDALTAKCAASGQYLVTSDSSAVFKPPCLFRLIRSDPAHPIETWTPYHGDCYFLGAMRSKGGKEYVVQISIDGDFCGHNDTPYMTVNATPYAPFGAPEPPISTPIALVGNVHTIDFSTLAFAQRDPADASKLRFSYAHHARIDPADWIDESSRELAGKTTTMVITLLDDGHCLVEKRSDPTELVPGSLIRRRKLL